MHLFRRIRDWFFNWNYARKLRRADKAQQRFCEKWPPPSYHFERDEDV